MYGQEPGCLDYGTLIDTFEHSGYRKGGVRFFKGSAPKQQATAAEIANDEAAADQLKLWKTIGKPLEAEDRADLTKTSQDDRTNFNRSRTDADIAQGETSANEGLRQAMSESGVDIGSTRSQMQLSQNADTTSAARAAAAVSAAEAGQQSMDADRAKVIDEGMKKTATADVANKALMSNQAQLAQQKQGMRLQSLLNFRNNIGSAAQALGGAAAYHYMLKGLPGVPGNTTTPSTPAYDAPKLGLAAAADNTRTGFADGIAMSPNNRYNPYGGRQL